MLRSVNSMLKPVVIDAVPRRYGRGKILTWPVDYLPFQWSYPKKKKVHEHSGDSIIGVPDLNRNRPAGPFAKLPELQNAPEGIKRIFSVDLASKQTVNDICEKELVELVQRHPYDVDSLEYKIAYKTFKIRLFREQYQGPFKHNLRLLELFNRTVMKRNKYLKMLGRQDLRRYHFVKDLLQIEHEFAKVGEGNKQFTRKGDLREKAQEWCDKTKAAKMDAYHAELKKLQVLFEVEKKETEEWMAKEIEELKLTEKERKELDFKGIFS